MRRLRIGALVVGLTLALTPAVANAAVSTTTAPTISGAAVAGGTITCNTVPASSWSSNDGGTPTPTDFKFFYSTDTTTPISETFSATNTYQLTTTDIGHKIVCKQTDTDEGTGDFTTSDSPASAATATVVAGNPPTHSGSPTVTGAAQVGQTLFCDDSGVTWTPAQPNGDFVNQAVSWKYNGSSSPISGATNFSYTLGAADIGKQLVCSETGTDGATGGQATVSSSPILPDGVRHPRRGRQRRPGDGPAAALDPWRERGQRAHPDHGWHRQRVDELDRRVVTDARRHPRDRGFRGPGVDQLRGGLGLSVDHVAAEPLSEAR
jgi:hypothetical protein